MSDIARRAIGLGAWLAFVVSAVTSLADTNPRKIYQKALPSVMTLDVENQVGDKFVGSAIVVLADDVALTAWHVVADARSVLATFSDGTQVQVVGCIDKDEARDLALLKLEKTLPGRRAVLNRELQSVATRAYVIGAPKGFGFSISDGLVSQVRQVDGFFQYQVSCPISPGNSGGPVLDERGRVIGIVSWTKSDAQNVSFAVPSQEVTRLKAANKSITWEQLAANTALPPLPQRVSSDQPVSTEEENSQKAFKDFTSRLEKSAGKKITVVVQEGGREEKFSFRVPHLK